MRRTTYCHFTLLLHRFCAPLAKGFFALAIMLVLGHAAHAQHKTISRADLEDILAHAITVCQLNDYCKTPDGFYPGTAAGGTPTRIVHEAEMASQSEPGSVSAQMNANRLAGKTFARYQDILRLIGDVRPRMVTDAVSQWGSWDWPVHLQRCRMTVRDIKAVDPDIVVQASVNEFVDLTTAHFIGTIPSWVWEAFGLPDEHRRFDIYRMMYSDWWKEKIAGVPQRWWRDYGTTEGQPNAIVPDIRTTEAKMWFYYQARMFIDMGCESVSFSQVELMNNNSYDPSHWNVVLQKVRAYGATRPDLRYLLLTGSTNSMRDPAHNLPFDFHICPVRPSELGTNLDASGGDCDITAASCEWQEGSGKIYGRSVGGRTPSGWWCSSLPSQVLIDNYGSNGPASEAGPPMGTGTCNIYHFDEITWFAAQDKAYRDQWLRYAYHRVRQLDPAVYLALPVKRVTTYRDYWYPADYLANNPKPGIFETPLTLGNQPGGDIDRAAVQLYCGYGQEDVIKSILVEASTPASQAGIALAPNPASNAVEIRLSRPGPRSSVAYRIASVQGAEALSGTFAGVKHQVDVSSLSTGLYFLTLLDGENRFVCKLLVR